MIKMIISVISMAVAITVIIVIGWQANWWLQNSVVNHQNQITHHSYNFEVANQQDAEKLIGQIYQLDVQIKQEPAYKQSLTDQKDALEQSFCNDYENLSNTFLTTQISAFAKVAGCNAVPNP